MTHPTPFLQIPLADPLQFQVAPEVKVPKHVKTVKLPESRQRYHELDVFRYQIEQSKAGIYHQPYTMNKKTVFVYKLIFFGLAGLFAALSFIAMSIPMVHAWAFFSISSTTFFKCIVVSICSLLAVVSFLMGFTLRTEREAVQRCIRKAYVSISRIYTRKRLRMGIKRFVAFFGPHRRLAADMRHTYHEICDKINDKKDETMHLVHRIATAETLTPPQKEVLLNQAIEELHDKLMFVIHSFRHS
jgi:hypothetical protein